MIGQHMRSVAAICSLMLGGLIAGAAARTYAQEPPARHDPAANAEAADTAAANATGAQQAKSADTSKPQEDKAFTKRALLAGWHPEVQRGNLMYCREEPIVGSRFTKKLCGTQVQVTTVLEQQEFERDKLMQHGSCSGGGGCGGSK
jgi:hypothetical protein